VTRPTTERAKGTRIGGKTAKPIVSIEVASIVEVGVEVTVAITSGEVSIVCVVMPASIRVISLMVVVESLLAKVVERRTRIVGIGCQDFPRNVTNPFQSALGMRAVSRERMKRLLFLRLS
jgi:hypothetical protein